MTTTLILQNHLFFLGVHTSKLLIGVLSMVDHVSLNIRRLKNNSLVSKFRKITKISKTKFVAKPPLQNQQSAGLLTI